MQTSGPEAKTADKAAWYTQPFNLHHHPKSQGDRLVRLAKHLWPDLTIGENQPYLIEDATDWFIPICVEPRALPHSLIEIRNDHL